MKGGMNAPDPSSYSSGSSYGVAVNGTVGEQAARVLEKGGGGNAAIGAQGQNAGPSASASYKMNGGKRSRGSRRNKRGGFFAGILNQAAAPFSLVGLNHLAKSMKRK